MPSIKQEKANSSGLSNLQAQLWSAKSVTVQNCVRRCAVANTTTAAAEHTSQNAARDPRPVLHENKGAYAGDR